RHTRLVSDWSSDVCSSDLELPSSPADHDSFADIFDELVRDLLQEPAREALLDAAEQQAAPGVSEVQPFARAGHPDIAEPPLLLQLVGLAQALGVREDPLFHPGEEHDAELEALGRVQRHER